MDDKFNPFCKMNILVDKFEHQKFRTNHLEFNNVPNFFSAVTWFKTLGTSAIYSSISHPFLPTSSNTTLIRFTIGSFS